MALICATFGADPITIFKVSSYETKVAPFFYLPGMYGVVQLYSYAYGKSHTQGIKS